MLITLTVTDGPHRGQVFTFEEHDNFIVGRSRMAHFRLSTRDTYFSRIHFMVEINPPHARLLDMGSTNGTHVNGRRVTVSDLRDGDVIRAGKTLLRVSIQPEEGEAPPTSPLPSVLTPLLKSASLPNQGASPRSDDPVCSACLAPLAEHAMLCPACQEAARARPQPIAGYQLVRELGRGSMGTVYLALRSADNALLALKMIMPEAEVTQLDLDRFLREVRILRGLDHPNIVTFRELGGSKGCLYFAMDYVRGTDAAQLLKTHGPLPVGRAVTLVCQLLEALAYAHARQLVHRDIKPANLLVTVEEGREVVKLGDFGLARVYQASSLSGLTLKGDVGGTLGFMAPEQITCFRETKPPADQYAAAATLYNLLTACCVYDPPVEFHEQVLMILHEDPIPILKRRPDLPADLAATVHRALAREPQARFPDVQAFQQGLLPYCQ
jgi:serine/threonine-protein kinase